MNQPQTSPPKPWLLPGSPEKLSREEQRLAALDPDCPPALLEQLWEDWPQEILQNPVLSLLTLEDARWGLIQVCALYEVEILRLQLRFLSLDRERTIRWGLDCVEHALWIRKNCASKIPEELIYAARAHLAHDTLENVQRLKASHFACLQLIKNSPKKTPARELARACYKAASATLTEVREAPFLVQEAIELGWKKQGSAIVAKNMARSELEWQTNHLEKLTR